MEPGHIVEGPEVRLLAVVLCVGHRERGCLRDLKVEGHGHRRVAAGKVEEDEQRKAVELHDKDSGTPLLGHNGEDGAESWTRKEGS
jgi:hypothetical protein